MAERQMMTVDGNEAAASVAHRGSEVIAIYPITPSSSRVRLSSRPTGPAFFASRDGSGCDWSWNGSPDHRYDTADTTVGVCQAGENTSPRMRCTFSRGLESAPGALSLPA